MITVILAILGLAVLIIGHEAGHFFAAKKFGMRVDEFGIGFPPRAKAVKRGDTEYSLNWLPFGGFVRIRGEGENPEELDALSPEEKEKIFMFQPAYRRIIVIAAGVAVNFLFGWLLLALVLMIGVPPALIITGVETGSPAYSAGIKEGDIIRNYTDTAGVSHILSNSGYGKLSEDFINYVNSNRGKEVSFTVIRDGMEKTISAIPRINTKPDQGALGIQLSEGGVPKEPFLKALGDGFLDTLLLVKLIAFVFLGLLQSLFFQGSVPNEVGGPIRIVAFAYETGKIGLVYLLQMLSSISVSLAVLNLVPFPALDGGQILFIAIEKVKGSPLSHTTRSVANTIGIALLFMLMIFISVRDIQYVQQVFFS